MKLVRTVCPYCGIGCGMIVKVRNGRIVSVYPEKSHPSNAGTLCIKGWKGVRYVGHPERLKKPLIRKGGRLVEASWGEALRTAAQGLGNALREWGP
ncbi:MAG: molybdopterin-dependent oxidoreductase, partial [Thermoplasmata archaeon]|nr:molybdopterin-dependent oxidoreductase [Thermoplasmata archaeon]